ncbi:MAG: [acyl-carrier-protein] S-malonyltransferase [Spirochaetes bacterium GWF1_31_7]|nr:MAG: [acyl-carrier-protein] S-malonyltransferase [Spirochaetes bacterium GWE1_32_154]OHD46243.1 MAG: [acyl-carrier-protein] S-malonyltransferase [Spirochaetes bacterium GWE2_31_10]OHD48613.1 MAG: [acyl-carrier-protein] S-malonyltransferase [Spirochaetes bacterium GWF1_31_7]HBI39202.1 [acyl-carrier-protein] S-malonyltransferase [Spirochaetia bacterium]
MKTAVLFAGQGSQFIGMGKDLYDAFPLAKEIFDTTNDILGIDIKKICFEGPEEELTKTENTQPAILMMSYICYKLLEQEGIKADVFGGFSLGEYSALTAAGYISYADGVKLVRDRGLIMENAVKGMSGAMAAILGLEDNQVEEVCAKAGGIVVPANYNCPGQLVISGELSAVEKACELAKEAGAKRALMLKVSGPFHSPLLKDAGVELAKTLDQVTFNKSNSKVLSNVTALIHNPEMIKNLLVEQMYSPVKWRKSMENLLSEGYDTFIEVGPGATLTGFMKKINKEVKSVSIGSVETFNNAISSLKS